MTDITPTQEDIYLCVELNVPEYEAIHVARFRQAAIASVIAHATSDEAVERAGSKFLELQTDLSLDGLDSSNRNSFLQDIEATITAAFTEV